MNKTLSVLALVAGQIPVAVSAAGVLQPIMLEGHGKTYAWETGRALTSSSVYRLGGHDYISVIERRKEFFRHSGRFERKGLSAMLDWHPRGGVFRLTAGLFFKTGRLSFLSGPEATYDYPRTVLEVDTSALPDAIRVPGGTYRSSRLRELGLPEAITHNGADIPLDTDALPQRIIIPAGSIAIDRTDFSVAGSVTFNPVSPYVGLGWGSPPGSNKSWRYSIDVGLLYHNRAVLDAGLNGRITGIDAKWAGVMDHTLRRRVAEVQRDLDGPVFLPYVSLALSVPL